MTLLNQTSIKLIVLLSDRLSTPKLTQRHHRRQFQEFQDLQSDRLQARCSNATLRYATLVHLGLLSNSTGSN
ncbi:hypothetical protein K4039_08775 [Lyngbya sp. CCAP 1446/10]|uniref:hypothetical protein n=1 Tax=Lyngbya sp. CCAP 1446/10 TaxID=439293 RepID=UPI002237C276|nr:hypothetical protein [Lyngbya sp. CCAP 1446/10]MCW6050174.1 hypothetical protein [Lyngbya sp. CCAP 1446/10]